MSFIVKKDATEGFKEAKSSTSVEQVGEVLLDRIDRHQALSSHAIYQPDNSIKKINFLKINEGHLGICTRSKRIFTNCLWGFYHVFDSHPDSIPFGESACGRSKSNKRFLMVQFFLASKLGFGVGESTEL